MTSAADRTCYSPHDRRRWRSQRSLAEARLADVELAVLGASGKLHHRFYDEVRIRSWPSAELWATGNRVRGLEAPVNSPLSSSRRSGWWPGSGPPRINDVGGRPHPSCNHPYHAAARSARRQASGPHVTAIRATSAAASPARDHGQPPRTSRRPASPKTPHRQRSAPVADANAQAPCPAPSRIRIMPRKILHVSDCARRVAICVRSE